MKCYRPIARREVQSGLVACHTEALQRVRNHTMREKYFLTFIFSHQQGLLWQLNAMHYTASVFCFCAQNRTRPWQNSHSHSKISISITAMHLQYSHVIFVT